MALLSAADRRSEEYTRHLLEPLAPILAANPRQVKRTINAVSLYQEVARIDASIQTHATEWCKLALWIIPLNNNSLTWDLLASDPGSLDAVDHCDESVVAKDLDLQRVRSCPSLLAVLNFESIHDQWSRVTLTSQDIEMFNQFTPRP